MVFEETMAEDVIIPNASPLILILIAVISLVAWFLVGFILSRWVKKDLNDRESDAYGYIPAVIFTSIAGFIVYLIVRYNEKCALQEDEVACELEEIYESEKETQP